MIKKLLLSFFLVNSILITSAYSDNIPASDKLGLMAFEQNKSLPKMSDNETRIDKVYVEGLSLVMNHTLINLTKNEVDAKLIEKAIKPIVMNKLCSISSSFDTAKSYYFAYYDKNQKYITAVSVWKNDCKKITKHDIPPKKGKKTEVNAEAFVSKVKDSEYYNNLQDLEKFVISKTVVNSHSGDFGFILFLSGDTWAMAYKKGNIIASLFGEGKPDKGTEKLIFSRGIENQDSPTIESEVRKSHGHIINTLSYGSGTFNFSFNNGRELDFKLINNKNVPAVSVYWEQW